MARESIWVPASGRLYRDTDTYENTPEEQARVDAYRAELANEAALREQADDALVANAAYLGHPAVPDGTLTAAQLSNAVRQLTDQVDALTRQSNKLIRLVLRKLEATD